MKDLARFFVPPTDTIEGAIRTIQRGGEGIALVVDDTQRLMGTITDGDIRRALLSKIPLTSDVHYILDHRPLEYQRSTVVVVGTSSDQILSLMKERVLRQIPIVDEAGIVVDLALLSEFITAEVPRLTAVVMAGGEGQRLRPLTEKIPKPMLLLNNRPLMERTIEQLRKSGVQNVNISTNYKSEVITDHFGNGDRFGVHINYINEVRPLGTAGALGLMERPDHPTLIINGDIVTQLDFRSMLDFHQSNNAIMTVGVKIYEFKIPYGVVETDDVMVTSLVEKPVQSFNVSAGIYLLQPEAYAYIPSNTYFHMTDLITQLLRSGQRVISFPIQEYWLDIGQYGDYQRATEDAKNGQI